MKAVLVLGALSASANAYWLMAVGTLFESPQRLDPIINPGTVSGHAHKILGGSNFAPSVNTAALRQSECTTTPIKEDKSNYWVPNLYFEWANGSVSYVDGGAVIYYLFPDQANTTTPFPDDFRMLSGNPSLRSYNSSSYAQQAVSWLCLNYTPGSSTSKHTGLPTDINCPDGTRAQLNFPSCWNGRDSDSVDHKSHVAFRSGGPDSGDCEDPEFPYSLPRIFIEIYYGTQTFLQHYSQAKNPSQPFVLANGDATGYGHHGDFINGWETATLKKAVDECHCNEYGDPTCCGDAGIFTYDTSGSCQKTNMVDEPTTGTLSKLPGNNPITGEGGNAVMPAVAANPGFLSPVYVFTNGVYPSGPYSTVPGGAVATSTSSSGSRTTSSTATTSTSKSSTSTHGSATKSSSSMATATSTGRGGSSNTSSTGRPGHVLTAASSSTHAATSSKDSGTSPATSSPTHTKSAGGSTVTSSSPSSSSGECGGDSHGHHDAHHYAHHHEHGHEFKHGGRARRLHRRHMNAFGDSF